MVTGVKTCALPISTQAHAALTARDSGPARARRIAVRRYAAAEPLVVFTFLERLSHAYGRLFAIGITVSGQVLNGDEAMRLLRADGDSVGEVPWSEVERQLASRYENLVAEGLAAARAHVNAFIGRERVNRTEQAIGLREEAARYYDDRLTELAAEEAAERAGARTQTELFRESRTDWAARRAATATHRDTRLREIEIWVNDLSPTEPEPLGALIVFPES